MACVVEQQPNFKHFCRVCNKGFMCGRALGGHMRAHGIGNDDNWNFHDEDDDDDDIEENDDDQMSDWESERLIGGQSDNNRLDNRKRTYQLRTNPNRLKSCRACENCGKVSFLDHGKCGSNCASDSLVSSPEHDDAGGQCNDGYLCKRKKTLCSKGVCLSSETYVPSEEDDLFLARCLVELANTTVVVAEEEESCNSASREAERLRANFDKVKGVSNPNKVRMFECKSCNKVFNSHQALGGHRASHKKVKGCFASKHILSLEDVQNNNDHVMTNKQDRLFIPSKPPPPTTTYQFEQGHDGHAGASKSKSKVHECSICHRVFTSGQALGGHKRCHWIASNAPVASPLLKFHPRDNVNLIQKPSNKLDLNVPPWAHVLGAHHAPQSLASFKVPTEMNLTPWIQRDTRNNISHVQHHFQLKHRGNDNKTMMNNDVVDDEADSELKLAKLSDLNDLKDMAKNENSSQWLQVGIGTTTESATTTTTTITTAVADA